MMTGKKRGMARAMKRVYDESGGGIRGGENVEQAFKDKKFAIRDFSIKMLAEATMGKQWVENIDPRRESVYMESHVGGSVDSTAFGNLTTTVISGLLDEPEREVDVNLADRLARTIDVPFEAGEKVIGLRRVGREANRVVQEGEEYSAYGFGEDWATKPDTQKRGGYVLLTREAIAEDRTGRIFDMARTIIDEAIMNKNERILLAVLGVDNTIYEPQGVAEATYTADSSALLDPNRDNLVASGAELIDWTDLDQANLLWADMRHRDTDRPIVIAPERMQMIVMPAKEAETMRLLGMVQSNFGTVTATAGEGRGAPQPHMGLVKELISSNLSYALLQRSTSDNYLPGGGVAAAAAQDYWYMGDFARAFEYRQQFPLRVETIGADTLLGFTRDVVFGVKASEKGVVSVNDPRFVVQLRRA